MRLIQQAPYDWGCGYACLAMLTKLPIAEVLDRAGMADQPKDSKKLRLTYRRMFELLRDLRIEHTAQAEVAGEKRSAPYSFGERGRVYDAFDRVALDGLSPGALLRSTHSASFAVGEAATALLYRNRAVAPPFKPARDRRPAPFPRCRARPPACRSPSQSN